MRIRARHAGAAALCLAILLEAPSLLAAAYTRPGRTERISVSTEGSEGEFGFGYSLYPSVSGDGRFVSFASNSTNLVAGDTNGKEDIFVRDRGTGAVERVSVASDEAQANGFSNYSAISADGRYVVIVSSASNLVAGDTNGASDVFLHDRDSGSTERISVASDGTQANTPPSALSLPRPAVSANGAFVAFVSNASNLVPGDTNGVHDVFLRDRATGTTERISVATDGAQGDSQSSFPAISADGRYIAFGSTASNLISNDSNRVSDVFLRDRTMGTTERISLGGAGNEGDSLSSFPAMSADGRYIAFGSSAANLVPSDTNAGFDVFVHDTVTNVVERVSLTSDGSEMSSSSASPASVPAMSADGRYVAFMSWTEAGPVRLADDTSFLRDRETGTTHRLSVSSNGTQANSNSVFGPAISADGRYTAFTSNADNLVPGDTNGTSDVFVRDVGPTLGVGGIETAREGEQITVSGWATFSGEKVSSSTDPPDDGATPGTEPAGAELTGASLVYRPERDDLLLRMRLASLPGPFLGGMPTVVYGLELSRESVSYQIRALRVSASAVPPAAPMFALYRCDAVCTETARLSGGLGTSGMEVSVSVPLASLDAAEGSVLSDLEVFTGLGEAGSGAIARLDEAALPDVAIPMREVSIGIADASSAQDEVTLQKAALSAGGFTGTLPDPGPEEHLLWVRACLGTVCDSSARRIVTD